MLGTGGLESRDSRTSQNADELGDAGADPEAARGVQGCGRWAPRGRPEQKVQNRAVYRTVVRQDGIKADRSLSHIHALETRATPGDAAAGARARRRARAPGGRGPSRRRAGAIARLPDSRSGSRPFTYGYIAAQIHLTGRRSQLSSRRTLGPAAQGRKRRLEAVNEARGAPERGR